MLLQLSCKTDAAQLYCQLGRPERRMRGRSANFLGIWTHSSAGAGGRCGRRSAMSRKVFLKIYRGRDLAHLECDTAVVAYHLRADLDQLLLRTRQRPLLDRFWRNERSQEITKIVSWRVELEPTRSLQTFGMKASLSRSAAVITSSCAAPAMKCRGGRNLKIKPLPIATSLWQQTDPKSATTDGEQ